MFFTLFQATEVLHWIFTKEMKKEMFQEKPNNFYNFF